MTTLQTRAINIDVPEVGSLGFEEPGALEQVAELATGWFTAHLHIPEAGA